MKRNSENRNLGRSFAFTLAEVLITHAIIGIVAAMTIPSIISSHQKTALAAQFAKTYRTLSQIINLAIAEHGEIDSWDWSAEDMSKEDMDAFVRKYFIPYLNVAKFYSSNGSAGFCFPKKIRGLYNSIELDKNSRGYPQVLLADGSCLQFNFWGQDTAQNQRSMSIDVDVNSVKKPNVVARDNFGFDLFSLTNEFLPVGVNKLGTYNEETKSFKKRTPEKIIQACVNTGWECNARILMDGFKMNY